MRRHMHGRGCALVEQDYLRRILLRERDKPGGAAPALIGQTVRFAPDHGYHVVLEGTGPALLAALNDPAGPYELASPQVELLPEAARRRGREGGLRLS